MKEMKEVKEYLHLYMHVKLQALEAFCLLGASGLNNRTKALNLLKVAKKRCPEAVVDAKNSLDYEIGESIFKEIED